jgi:hypothetical protein
MQSRCFLQGKAGIDVVTSQHQLAKSEQFIRVSRLFSTRVRPGQESTWQGGCCKGCIEAGDSTNESCIYFTTLTLLRR